MSERPFLDYYIKHGISPVSQDISDRSLHFRRRSSLYRLLGVAPGLVADKRVLEFGPGSGHNALHTLSLRPSRYLLVDGNAVGLELTRALLASAGSEQGADLEFIHSDFHDFDTEERFDLVLCEGFLPLQLDPESLLKRLSGFVGLNGLLVCTCIDALSYLPDLLRRAVGQALIGISSSPLPEQARSLARFFRPHFETLANMSRPVEDWIMDNVLHPFFGRLLSMSEAIGALEDRFEVYSSSPRFFADWRWYKDINGERSGGNAMAIEAWRRNVHNFLDHDVLMPERGEAENMALYALAEEFVGHNFAFYDSRAPHLLLAMSDDISAIADNLAALGETAGATVKKLQDGAAALRQAAQGSGAPDFGTFVSLFGRGQQYLSFVRVS